MRGEQQVRSLCAFPRPLLIEYSKSILTVAGRADTGYQTNYAEKMSAKETSGSPSSERMTGWHMESSVVCLCCICAPCVCLLLCHSQLYGVVWWLRHWSPTGVSHVRNIKGQFNLARPRLQSILIPTAVTEELIFDLSEVESGPVNHCNSH